MMTDAQADAAKTTRARKAADPTEPEDPKEAACAAFVAALGELSNPGRDSRAVVETKKGGTYSYAYAGLDAVLDLVRPVLARHGLALTQPVEATPDGLVKVTTRILHRRGEVALQAPTIARVVEGGPQELGSFVTYARRYQVLALLGIHPAGEDDDAAAAQPSRSGSGRPEKEPGLPDPIVGGLHMSERTDEALRDLVAGPPSARVGAMAQAWLDLREKERLAPGEGQATLPDADHDDDAGAGYGS
jgi:hypothetical protein